MLTAGHRGDSPQFTTVLDGINVPRLGGPELSIVGSAGRGFLAAAALQY